MVPSKIKAVQSALFTKFYLFFPPGSREPL